MIILDFLFNICYAPFLKVKQNGRFAALIWLTPPLTFISVGILHIFLYYLNIQMSSIAVAIMCFTVFAIIFFILNRVYVKNNRYTGTPKFPVLCALLIFVMIIGSIIFFSVAIGRFR
jgi:hypothetical protein